LYHPHLQAHVENVVRSNFLDEDTAILFPKGMRPLVAAPWQEVTVDLIRPGKKLLSTLSVHGLSNSMVKNSNFML
jgi:hypothetical protein